MNNPTGTPYKTATAKRPACAAEVAAWSNDLREYGYNHADWLHELALVHSRAEFRRRIEVKAPRMADKFPDGDIADATLAAEIECLCLKHQVPCPAWVVLTPCAHRAWFSRAESTWARAQALQEAPAAFRQRNIFYVPWFSLTLKAGRPAVSTETKRQRSAARSARYRSKLLKDAGRGPFGLLEKK